MTNVELKELAVQRLESVTEDIEAMADQPSHIECYNYIRDLFEVMRLLADIGEKDPFLKLSR